MDLSLLVAKAEADSLTYSVTAVGLLSVQSIRYPADTCLRFSDNGCRYVTTDFSPREYTERTQPAGHSRPALARSAAIGVAEAVGDEAI